MMDSIFIYPDKTQRQLKGPIPRKGEVIDLDSWFHYKKGTYVVRHVGYVSEKSIIYAVVYLRD